MAIETNSVNIGDLVEIRWLDTSHEDSISHKEVLQMQPEPCVSWGKLMVKDRKRVIVVGCEFPSDADKPLGDRELREITCIIAQNVLNIKKLKEV